MCSNFAMDMERWKLSFVCFRICNYCGDDIHLSSKGFAYMSITAD